MEVQVINKSNHRLPEYKTPGSSGVDLKANIDTPIKVLPMERILVPTGLFVAIPEGYEIQVRPRSGLSLKAGLEAIFGTLDSDYRGEVGIILINLSNDPQMIYPGDRLAQAVLNKVERIDWKEVEQLDETERKGGFGSTGI